MKLALRAALVSAALLTTTFAQTTAMRIYWIDTEGGASTLFLSPSGESMLFDTGFKVGDRHAKRI